jgi:uncharacterized protein DUF2752
MPAPRFRLRRLGPPAATLALVAAASTYVALVDPRESGHYPPCPYLWVTGLACPGCGGLRCVHALTHLDLPAALGYNALAVAMFPVIGWLWLRWTMRVARGEPRRSLSDPRLLWALLAVVLLFWVVRDLPFGAVLAP